MKPESNRRALRPAALLFTEPIEKLKTRKAKTNGHADIWRKFFFVETFSAVFPGQTRNPARIKTAHATQYSIHRSRLLH
jgi:hypothetical protein